MARFTSLRVWQASRTLVQQVSIVTAGMRNEGDLRMQMRRAAISVASNIAEGCERGSDRDFHRYLVIARASAAEVEAQAIIAGDCGCLAPSAARNIEAQAQSVARMLHRLMERLAGSG